MKKRIISYLLTLTLIISMCSSFQVVSYAVSETVVNDDFETNAGNWTPKGGASVTVSDAQAHGGSQSLAITGRAENWEGAELNLTASIEAGVEYTVSAWVYQEATTSAAIKLTMEQNTAEKGTEYIEVAVADGGQIPVNTWTEVKGKYTLPAGETLTRGALYVEAPEIATLDFYMDDVVITREKDLVDEDVSVLVAADYETDTDNWTPKGGASVTVSDAQAHGGSQSLEITGREQNWEGAELNLTASIEVGVEYTVSAWVYHEGAQATTIKLTMEQNTAEKGTEYIEVAVADGGQIPVNTWTEVKGKYRLPAGETLTKGALYVEAPEVATLDFYMDDVLITYPKSGWAGITTSFENGLDGFTGRIGEETLTISTDQARTGNQSVYITGRTKPYAGISYNLLGKATNNKTYAFSAWIYQETGNSQPVIMSIHSNVTSDVYTNIAKSNIPSGKWTEIKGEYGLEFSGDLSQLSVYLETKEENATMNFYVDDFTIGDIENSPIIIEDLPAIKDAYKDHFTIGVAIPGGALTKKADTELITKHFNSITAENNMKPSYMLDESNLGSVDLTNADEYFNYAKDNNLKLRGHVLLWHQQTPDWFFKEGYLETGDFVSREVMLQRMDEYIGAIINQYSAETLYAWDVVNEAIDTSEPDNLRDSLWKQVVGPDFVEKAFEFARNHTEGSNVKLFYNDYDCNNITKRDAIYELVTDLKDKGLIDGMGIQSHISMDSPSVDKIEETIRLFGDYGFEVQITELDVDVYSSSTSSYDSISEEMLIEQGYRYKELFEMFKKNSDVISNVTVWGLKDDQSWLNYFPGTRSNWPLIFDKDYKAKYAYYGIVSPSDLPVFNQEIEAYKSSITVDGQEDFAFDIQKPIAIKATDSNPAVKFKTAWDTNNLYAYITVEDDTVDANDSITMMIDGNRSKDENLEADDVLLVLNRNGEMTYKSGNEGEIVGKVISNNTGYTIEVAIPIPGATMSIGEKVGFDLMVTDNTSVTKWNDPDDSGKLSPERFGIILFKDEALTTSAKKGTPIIDANSDKVWENANVVDVDKYTMNTIGATAKVKTLWDENFIYIYADVTDSNLSKASVNAYEQDSLEIFFDENNNKTASYEADDIQYRVNYDNETSIAGGPSPSKFVSKTRITDTGYIVEAAVPYTIEVGQAGNVYGFDLQVNDDHGTGSRNSIVNWSDMSGNGWRSTENFGFLILANENSDTDDTDNTDNRNDGEESSTPGDNSNSGEEKETVEVKIERSNNKEIVNIALNLEASDIVDVAVEVEGNADGSVDAVLPADIFKEQDKGEINDLIIKAPLVDMVIPIEAIEDYIGADAKEVELSVEKADLSKLPKETIDKIGDAVVLDFNLYVDGQQISKFNKSITISMDYELKKGENPNTIVVYYINDQGKLEVINNVKYNPETGKIVFKVDHFSYYAITNVDVSYTDIGNTHWAAAAVYNLSARGIVSGYNDDLFSPSNDISRAEFIKLIVVGNDLLVEGATASFVDIDESDWYYEAVASAEVLGIVTGYNGKFNPDETITRQDMATMLYRTMEVVEDSNPNCNFKDLKDVSDYALKAVKYFNSKGVIKGYSNQTFKPKNNASRAEAAVIIYRWLELLN